MMRVVLFLMLCVPYLIVSLIPGIVLANTPDRANNSDTEDCSCEKIGLEQAFREASYVAFGEVKVVTQHSPDLATGHFELMNDFKSPSFGSGSSPYLKKVVGASEDQASCRRVLSPGYYLLFSKRSQNVVLNSCSASQKLKPGTNLVSTLTKIQNLSDLKAKNSVKHTSAQSEPLVVPEDDWSIDTLFQDVINFLKKEFE